MRFFQSTLVGLTALVSMVAAQSSSIAVTSTLENVVAGSNTQITWIGGPVDIRLRWGNPGALEAGIPIAQSVTGNSFTWAVPSTLPPLTTYAIEITAGSEVNYSPQFPITGGTGSLSSAASSASASASSVASSIASSVASSITSDLSSLSSALSSATAAANSTTVVTSTANATATTTRASTSRATPTETVAPNSMAAGISSPLALVLCVFAAMFYLN